jgi:hypothetical protein
MEYFLIFVLQMLGIAFHVMQKIIKLGDQYPTLGRKEIFNIFLQEDWDTLCVSGLIIVADELAHYIIDEYTPDFRSGINYYILYAFGIAFMLGYLGQRFVYKWLGSAEKFIDKKVEGKLQ